MILQNKLSLSFWLVLITGYLSVFPVQGSEQPIKFKSGEIVRSDFEPDVHFQVPFINDVNKFNTKVLTFEIYADGYDNDPEFFARYRSLTSYKKAFKDKNDVIVLNPNSEYFRYFGRQ